MELPPVIIFEPGRHEYLIPTFAFIHEDCIETDFTLATFQPPFQHQNPEVPDPRVLEYWSNNAARVAEDTKVIFMQMAVSESGHEELAGYVVLASQASETGPFRGSVEKLLVSPRYRRRGIARLLMSKLEEVARVRGTTLLTLDTEAGSPAEGIYPRLGYTRLGKIPRYGVSPKDGRLVDEVFFYKDLRST
ncbi:acyl-CoA N-acyltransferase [Aureobasidium sp. EXF-8845]|nr:acyl-CoA N-acyltransferase [Aureobasidium sp. EXF-8845]KAI4789885.1 acyl-CoA N-acyltransferase [Aureobasidium sp. EXF-8846]